MLQGLLPQPKSVLKYRKKVGHTVGKALRCAFLDGGAAAAGFLVSVIDQLDEDKDYRYPRVGSHLDRRMHGGLQEDTFVDAVVALLQ